MTQLVIALLIFCYAAHAADTTSMNCLDKARTCKVTGFPGSSIKISKTFPDTIKEVQPRSPENCDPLKTLCTRTGAITNKLILKGKIKSNVNQLKFTSDGQAPVFIVLAMPIPNPICTKSCTKPDFVDVQANGTVNRVSLSVNFAVQNPEAKAFKKDYSTEVPDIFGSNPNKLSIEVGSGETLIRMAGTLRDPTVTRLQVSANGKKISIMISRNGKPLDCPDDLDCASPHFIIVDTSDNYIDPVKILVQFPAKAITFEAFNDKTLVPGVVGIGPQSQCDSGDSVCVRALTAVSNIFLSGMVSNPEVANLKFSEGSESQWTSLRWLIDIPCPEGLACTSPPYLRMISNRSLIEQEVMLPFTTKQVTGEGFNDDTLVANVFGPEPCNPSEFACAIMDKHPKTIEIFGILPSGNTEVRAAFDKEMPWTFKISSACRFAAYLFVIVSSAATFVYQ